MLGHLFAPLATNYEFDLKVMTANVSNVVSLLTNLLAITPSTITNPEYIGLADLRTNAVQILFLFKEVTEP